jgi:hypothetical protein
VRRAACVGHQGRRLLILELWRGAVAADLAPVRNALAWAGIDEVRIWRRIPVDARHNAKVDYGTLAARLSGRSGLSRLHAARRVVHRTGEGSGTLTSHLEGASWNR